MHPAEDVTTPVTANELMKQRSEAWLPRAITIAVLFHVAVFTLSPDVTTAEDAAVKTEMDVIIPKKLELPEAPPPIERPATPIVGSIEIDPQVTISSTDPDTYRMDSLPPPARLDSGTREKFKWIVPTMVAPRLLNPAEVERELRRTYPAILRDAGIGGDVDVNIWLDENGVVVKAEIGQGSGYELLDEAALRVVDAMRLAPAQNQGLPVRVIVTVPVRFRVQ
jgi:periplasmic protein TonB